MERGVYFDAWFPRQHCYHPSLPARRLRMVDDLRDYHATVLVWSALGGGSISLPYLEQEAFGEIDPRFRFYGFVNDSEFIQECHKYGIKVFGIVFEVQGWEFPVELNEAEDTILAINETRLAGKRSWIGLREFSQNRYPALWAPLSDYFPAGLADSDGVPVTDLIETCSSRDIYGEPCHAHWVECPDREHQCFMMDRNNPVWRAYLKAVIRIQIDAGVDGVQLDEAELPITSFQYGGCFCKACMQGFRIYLQGRPPEILPPEMAGVDLSTFHYGEWLLGLGYDFKTNREETPLFWEYHRFQQGAIKQYFAELADYARQYATEQGKRVLVSGNFFNLFDHYYPLEPKVDLIITEMRNTRYRQPAWYRYVAGFAAGKPVIVVENPYGGVVPALVEKLKVGKGYDLFRMSLYEAAALGANMSVPYGAWMGSVIQDSFHPPHDLCTEIQSFLAAHDDLYSPHTCAEVGVVYSVESNFQRVAKRDLFADNRANISGSETIPFWEVCHQMVNTAQPYDVIFFPDGELRPDSLTTAQLCQYRTLILPDCRFLTARQVQCLVEFLQKGGALIVLGDLGVNLPLESRQAVLNHRGTRLLEDAAGFGVEQLPGGPQVRISQPGDGSTGSATGTGGDIAVNIHKVEQGAALHLMRYGYEEAQDRVPLLPSLDLEVRIPGDFTSMRVYAPDRLPQAAMLSSGGTYGITLRNVPLYCVVLLSP